jgi:hypothetical protein
MATTAATDPLHRAIAAQTRRERLTMDFAETPRDDINVAYFQRRFPDDIASHAREQVSFFGPDGLPRRHDDTVDIPGGTAGANYAYNYETVDGSAVPARRTILGYEGACS